MPLRFELTHDADAFAARAGALLEDAIERNLPATVLANVRAGPGRAGLFACGVDDGGELCAAALRSPPFPLLVTDLGSDPGGSASALIDAWLPHDPDLPSVNAVPETARAAGAHTCSLFTDRANPTSNAIYAEVGYTAGR